MSGFSIKLASVLFRGNSNMFYKPCCNPLSSFIYTYPDLVCVEFNTGFKYRTQKNSLHDSILVKFIWRVVDLNVPVQTKLSGGSDTRKVNDSKSCHWMTVCWYWQPSTTVYSYRVQRVCCKLLKYHSLVALGIYHSYFVAGFISL